MKSPLLKTSLLTAVVASAVLVCSGQSQLPGLDRNNLKGKVKLATLVREFWIIGGVPLPPKQVVLTQREFDRDGQLIRDSHFGNVERRQLYTYRDGKKTVETLYFDSAGQQIPTDKAAFQPKADIPVESDLCPAYFTKRESDKQAGIERSIETCSSGSLRATTTTEKNTDSTYFRTVREDAKGRTYEHVVILDAQENPIEYRYIVSNSRTPTYSWNISYANHKLDSVGNLIEMVASAVHSSKPNHVSYQIVERFEIVYY